MTPTEATVSINGHTYAVRAARYLGRCRSCKRGVTALVTQWANELQPDRWRNREGEGYTLHNGVYADCPDCGRGVLLEGVQGRYKPEVRCSDKCRNAIGPSCDCECGGINHGCNH